MSSLLTRCLGFRVGVGGDEGEMNQNEKDRSKHSNPLKGSGFGFWDVFCFGICISSFAMFNDWTVGYVYSFGYWGYLFSMLLTSFLFINLHFCVAEMVSILPFSGKLKYSSYFVHCSIFYLFLCWLSFPFFLGGTYGFARVTVGPYIGFLVGCFEVFSNLVSTAGGALPIAIKISYITGWDRSYEPLYLLALYLFMIGWELIGRKYYFAFLKCLAIIILTLVIIYLIVSARYINTEQFLPESEVSHTYEKGGIVDLLSIMPYTGFYYFGLDIIPLVCDEVKNVRQSSLVSFSFFLVFFFVFLLSFFLCFFWFCRRRQLFRKLLFPLLLF
jgi:ethanolamine permease